MSKGTYSIISGEEYFVKANSAEEAEAIYMIALGHMDAEDYPQFDITPEQLLEVEYIETNTIVEPVRDFSVSG